MKSIRMRNWIPSLITNFWAEMEKKNHLEIIDKFKVR